LDEQLSKEYDACKWLSCEIILKAFNDILPCEWYSYYIRRYFKKKEKYVKIKLKKHYDAINWFSTCKESIFFEILNLNEIKFNVIGEAVLKKFSGNRRFNKILKDFQNKVEGETVDSNSRRTRKDFKQYK
jgi:hypothetical protein